MTIRDIAKESGYGISTVSRVLNNHADVSELARETILAVVKAKHFQLNNNAKHLKQRKSTIIAIIVKGTMNMLFSEIVETMQDRIIDSGYAAAVYYLDEEENEVRYASQLCRERNPAGICFLGGLVENFRQGFDEITLPSVLVTMGGEALNFPNLSSVTVDDRAGAKHAISHLLAAGHRNIGIIGGDESRSGPTHLRLQGCKESFLEYGIHFDHERQFEQSRYSYQSGYTAICHLMDKMPEMTAVFCMSDMMAIGAMRALGDSGKRGPEDISCVGYDGIPAALFSVPRLATIRQDAKEIGRCSVAILRHTILEGGEVEHILIPFHFVDGESIASPTE